MGRNSKRKAKRTITITLAGEQAEAFDAQMDADKAWFEANAFPVYLRPQIPGEWGEYEMFGTKPVAIGPIAPNGEPDFLDQQCVWTAVVDAVRLQAWVNDNDFYAPPSGVRMRFACTPPLDKNQAMEIAAEAAKQAMRNLEALDEMKRRQHKGAAD